LPFQAISFEFDEKTDRADTHSAMNVMRGKGLEERAAEVNKAQPGSEGRRYGVNRGERKKIVSVEILLKDK
jgi:hypothetical protein